MGRSKPMPADGSYSGLILASTSPYRRELLTRLGVPFVVADPGVDETIEHDEDAGALACRLARLKAAAVSTRLERALVIGSDQVAECQGRQLGKPGDARHARAQLEFVSGREIRFHTAVAVMRGGDERLRQVETRVQVRRLSGAQIDHYVSADRPFDCAGAMKSESLGIALAERISSDDPTALIGLPLIAVTDLLARFGVDVLTAVTHQRRPR